MDSLVADVRYAIRSLVKARGFAALALATLALGIGANTAIFSVVDAALLRPLPFDEPARLVRITADMEKQGATDVGLSNAELFDYRDRAGIFESIAGLYPVNANLTDVQDPERIEAQLVSGSYFEVLGVRAALGRVFTRGDETTGITEIAVITDGLWRRRFGGDRSVLGRQVRLDSDLYTIIGVLAPDFHHPGRGIEGEPEMFSPAGYLTLPVRGVQRTAYNLNGALARLAPGISVPQAQERIDAFGASLRAEHPADYPASQGWRPRVIALQDDLVGKARPTLLLLMAAVGAVLLIGCANVANLLLARATGRQREFALRGALGATRGRLVRQLLTESLVLAIGGGAAGLLVAAWLGTAARVLAPAALATPPATPDWRVLGFTIALSLATGVLFGLWPAWQSAAARPQEALKASTRSVTATPGHARTRRALVVAEFATTLVLLVTSALLVRSVSKLYAIDTGLRGDGVLAARLWMALPNNPALAKYRTHDSRVALYREILARLREVPGVTRAGFVQRLPFVGTAIPSAFMLDGQSADDAARNRAERIFASPGYFETVGIALQRGRTFEDRDDPQGAPAAIVSASFAERYLAGRDPIGQRIRMGGPASTSPWCAVVGVVGDVRSSKLEDAPPPQVYFSVLQFSNLAMSLVVRGDGPPAALEPAVRRVVRSIDGDLPLYGVRPLDDLIAASVADRRFAMTGLGAFALAGLVLASIGIYGVLSYVVQQRTGEIGVRMALGATSGDVLRLVIAEGVTLAVVGVAIGLGGAWLAAQAVSNLLYGVRPFDPLSFAGIAALLTLVAALACYLPARRATRIDPLTALRAE
jgi:putative ABC transport system permease protein